MTWLVVGASGQLGISVCKVLQERNIAYISPSSSDLNITNQDSISSFVDRQDVDVIVNCAAWTDVEGAEIEKNLSSVFAVNGDAVEFLAKAARKVGSKFVHISTDYVFSGSSNRVQPWSEEDLLLPVNMYGASKAKGDAFLKATGMDGRYLFRTAWLYSEHRKNFAKTMVKFALKDENEVPVVMDQVGQPTYARDLSLKIVDSLQHEIPFGIYHGTNSGQATWFEFAQEIFRLLDADVKRVKPVSSETFSRLAKRPAYSVLGHENWAKTSIDEMRNWKIALIEAIPSIVSAVKEEW